MDAFLVLILFSGGMTIVVGVVALGVTAWAEKNCPKSLERWQERQRESAAARREMTRKGATAGLGLALRFLKK